MDRDEFERLKAEEKAHLRQLRELKGQYRSAQRRRGLLDALAGITGALDQARQADPAAEALERDAAHQEARMELALDSAAERAEAERQRQERARFEAEQEAARQKAAADDLVRQMKAEMGAPLSPEQPGAAPTAAGAPEAGAPPAERSIGRPRGGADDAPPPGGKTIGRPRRER